jgi:hypothetical protein
METEDLLQGLIDPTANPYPKSVDTKSLYSCSIT